MNLELVKLVLSWVELGKPPSWGGKYAYYGYGKDTVDGDGMDVGDGIYGNEASAGDVEDVDDSFLLCEQSAPSYPAWHSQWPITHSPLPGRLS